MFCHKFNINPLSFSQIHYEFGKITMNSLSFSRIHYLFGVFTMNSRIFTNSRKRSFSTQELNKKIWIYYWVYYNFLGSIWFQYFLEPLSSISIWKMVHGRRESAQLGNQVHQANEMSSHRRLYDKGGLSIILITIYWRRSEKCRRIVQITLPVSSNGFGIMHYSICYFISLGVKNLNP